MPKLSTNRYTMVGTYIGQFISPKSVQLTGDVRLPVAIGRGSRLASVFNIDMRRSFVKQEELVFTSVAPFIAQLKHASNGEQDAPVRLYKSNGETVRPDQYQFLAVDGEMTQLLIRTEVYKPEATYFLDYQSTDRSVQDPLPVADLREIVSIGDQADQQKYREYEDFYLPMGFAPVVPAVSNTKAVSSLEAPIELVAAGTGTFAHASASQFFHDYNRYYTVECMAVSGTAPTRTATFKWTATPMSGGNFAFPPTPLHTAAPLKTFTIDESDATSLAQALELGIVLEADFGLTNYVAGDKWHFNGLGAALFEVDVRHLNLNETLAFSDITSEELVGTGVVTYGPSNTYTGAENIGFQIQCISAAGSAGSRTATFVWSAFREIGASGTFTINEASASSLTQSLSKGVQVSFDFGSSNFAAGDEYAFLVDVPFKFVYFKDNRKYKFAVTSATAPDLTTGTLQGTYSVNTPEGSFGLIEATAKSDGSQLGKIELPGNLTIIARNMTKGGVAGNNHAANDLHDMESKLLDVIDFSLTKPATDIRNPSKADDILLDITGAVTGTPNTYYSILSFVPLKDLKAVTSNPTATVTITQIANSPYVYFNSKPTKDVTITYRHRGQEPDTGDTYFFTGNYLRPSDFFNKLITVSSVDEGRRLLGPAAIDNHLYMANEIAWSQPGNRLAVGFIQVEDADSDGVYTITDYRKAIVAGESSSLITDRVLLSRFDALPDLLASNLRLSDPFKAKEHLLWIGAPVNTPVGSIDQEGSLVYLARKSLQVYGDSPAHGTRILVSPTYCDLILKLQDGTEATVRLDGSFYAFAEACKAAGLSSTSDSILLSLTTGFSNIQVHSEAERMKLGAANIVFPVSEGNGIFRTYEDVTVDKFAPDFENINAMIQKQYVTRAVRTAMTQSLLAIKITSGEGAIAIISGVLSRILLQLQSQGNIASWQDDEGNVRPFDPAKDIRVYRDSDNPTAFAFFYAYNLTYVLKRLNGLYVVDTAALELPASGNASSI